MTPGALLVELSRRDARALDYLVVRRRPILDRVLRVLTHLGDPPVVVSLALALLLTPAARELGRAVAIALVASHLGVQLLKRTITRPRPQLPVGVASLVQAPDRFSFPSGHATAVLAIALVLTSALPVLPGALLITLALLVGLSRCYLGIHYPGDVLAGWALAATGAALAILL